MHLVPRLLLLLLLPAVVLSAGEPRPLPLPLPRNLPGTVVQAAGQIERITFAPGAETCPAIRLPGPVGKAFTLTLWVRLNDVPSLADKGFGQDAPMTLADFQMADRASQDRRLVFRVLGGRFQVTSLQDGDWRVLRGFGAAATPDAWHFLAYTAKGGDGIFYVDGDITMRSRPGTAPCDALQVLILGNFDGRRRMDGVMVQPRLYGEALTLEQIQSLWQNRPASLR